MDFSFFKKGGRKEDLAKLKSALEELDQIAKMLVRRDLALVESKDKLVNEKKKIDAVINSLVDGLIMINKEERIVLINPQAKKFLGIEKDKLLDKKLSELNTFSYIRELNKTLGFKIEWTDRQYELIFRKPYQRIFQLHTVPVKSAVDEVIGLMLVLHDITREKEIERLKTDFVSLAAHQLRTPLSAVKWSLKMLLDGDVGKLTKAQLEMIRSGYNSNERMILLVNDLLNVTRIEEGRVLNNLVYQSIEVIIEGVLLSLKEHAKQKKIKLIFNKSPKPLPNIRVDEEKIRLVVYNIIDNAIRYNRRGGEVTVSIERDNMNIKITISDTGIGIPANQQDQLFSKFFRASNAIKTDTTGTGLGLFICKNIINAHNGRISVKSEEGKGTTFWIKLPIKN